jgi:starch synthase
VCGGDPLNVRTWSGTPFHMLEALQRHADVVEVVRKPWPYWFSFARRVVRRISRGRHDIYWSREWGELGSRRSIAHLAGVECDAVVAVAITPIAARLVDKMMTVFVSDATFFAMSGYNLNFMKLSPGDKAGAEEIESRAISRAALATFPSTWAQNSALARFPSRRERILQIPWGANLAASKITPAEGRPERPWRLLFVGVDWYGKGGDIALRTFELLKARGLEVQLDIVGCAPSDPAPRIEGVTFHGFIAKNTSEGRARLEALFLGAHLFLLPTRFDAFPTVIAESASFGVPAVSYRTGGLTSNVLDGETGILIDEGMPAEAFAEAITELMTAPDRYGEMAAAALRFSRESLNWDSWARRIVGAIAERLDLDRASSVVNEGERPDSL